MASDWLDKHVAEFVRPRLRDKTPEAINYGNADIRRMDAKQMSALLACWKEAKKLAGNRTILLAGRDVFLFEILARLEDFPTVFRPDISSETCVYIKDDYTNHYLLDTGYAGSVPRALKIPNFGLIRYAGSNGVPTLKERQAHQIFPRARQGCSDVMYNLAVNLETVQKYWYRATYNYDHRKVNVQQLSDDSAFRMAFELTLYVVEYVRAKEKGCVSSFLTTRSKAIAKASPPPYVPMPSPLPPAYPPPSNYCAAWGCESVTLVGSNYCMGHSQPPARAWKQIPSTYIYSTTICMGSMNPSPTTIPAQDSAGGSYYMTPPHSLPGGG